MRPKTIVIDGIRFTQSGREYYYNSSKRLYLHRYIWEKAHGQIPDGHHIHHIDGDAGNNELSNLELLEATEHLMMHAKNMSEEHKEKLRANLNENARPKAIEWHKSDEGRAWHKTHYENSKHLLHQKKEFSCDNCDKSFVATHKGNNRFCSNACKSAWRRNNGLDDIEVQCEVCGSKFIKNKYSKAVTCSRQCGSRLGSHRKRLVKDSPLSQEEQL